MRLELPVFHVGYFRHVLIIMQCTCKTCCKLLLTADERAKFVR